MADTPDDPGFPSSRSTRRQSRWLLDLARLAPAGLGWAVACPLLSGLLLLGQVWLLAQVLGRTVAHEMAAAAALPQIGLIIALIVLRAALAWSGERAASLAAEKIKSRLRQALFDRMLTLGPQWTGQRVSGELAATLIDQVEILDGFFVRYLPSVMAVLFLPLAFGVAVLPVDWIAALILLFTAPLIPVFMALVGWGAEAASRRHQLAMTRLSGFFADRLRGAFTLKLYGRERAEVAAVRRASHELSEKTMAVLKLAFLSSAVLEFFAALGIAGVALYVGLTYLGYLDLRGTALTLPLGLFCLLLTPEVYGPLRQFAANYHDRAAARAAAAQMAAVFDGLPSVDATAVGRSALRFDPVDGVPTFDSSWPLSADDTASPPVRAGGERRSALQVQDLVVCAPGRDKPVLDRVSFKLAQGQSAALMGVSGVGKTTLLEALMGLRAIEHGRIWLGADNDAVVDANAGKPTILISQRAFFLPGSIAGNLRIAKPDAHDKALLKALESACADDFVLALPQGLDTPLGVNGYGLSAGQLHRLALTRLFLTDPGLILLDEPTAHLDDSTRDRVVSAILRFAAGRSLIIATHDPDVADRMQSVLHLRDGTVQS